MSSLLLSLHLALVKNINADLNMRKQQFRSKTERFSGYHRHLVSQNFLPLPSLTLNHFVETLDLLPHILFFK